MTRPWRRGGWHIQVSTWLIGAVVLAACTTPSAGPRAGTQTASETDWQLAAPSLPPPGPAGTVASPQASASPAPTSPIPVIPVPEDPLEAPAAPAAGDVAVTPNPPTPSSAPRTSLQPGDSGEDVLGMQRRLRDLGYWLGEPDGTYGDLTVQAVYAVQKVSGLARDGVAGPATLAAIASSSRPSAVSGGTGIEIDLARQVLVVVREGAVQMILNTSTGSNKAYSEVYKGRTYTGDAHTPTGVFAVERQVDKLDEGPLGGLWRPKYFNGGIAVHGAVAVPPYPASHGCARVSNAAMNMIWANHLMPIGMPVTVY